MRYSITLTTTSTKENAQKIAHGLVEAKLAACASILPNLTSVYFWEEKICEDNEFLLVIKGVSGNFDAVKNKIIELHDYTLPEIIELPVQNGYEKYLKWIDDSLA